MKSERKKGKGKENLKIKKVKRNKREKYMYTQGKWH
jgi:hypothetical protein